MLGLRENCEKKFLHLVIGKAIEDVMLAFRFLQAKSNAGFFFHKERNISIEWCGDAFTGAAN